MSVHTDLAPFNVHILHPARTLIEKLLRVNNFAVDESRRENEEGWPRIGRQLYDIWALLGHPEVVQFLKDTNAASEVVKDCQQISLSFRPDHPVPTGGFSASDVFNMDWEHADRIRSEHDIAMSSLYYGSEPPTYEAVIARVRASAPLLNIGVSRR